MLAALGTAPFYIMVCHGLLLIMMIIVVFALEYTLNSPSLTFFVSPFMVPRKEAQATDKVRKHKIAWQQIKEQRRNQYYKDEFQLREGIDRLKRPAASTAVRAPYFTPLYDLSVLQRSYPLSPAHS